MSFWLRELAGWVLILLGLATFYLCIELLQAELFLQSGQLTVVGIVVFRGGVHLLKVAVAARIALKVERQLAADRTKPSPPYAWQPAGFTKRDRGA